MFEKLHRAIESELGELVTSSGRPRGRYKELIDHLESLQKELRDLSSRRQELSRTLDALEEAEDTLSRLLAGGRDQADQAEIEEVRARRNQLAELEAHISAAATEQTLKERDMKSAGEALEARRKQRQEIASVEQSVQDARAGLADITSEEKDLRAMVEALRTTARCSEPVMAEADAAVSRNRRVVAAVERATRLGELKAQCDKAATAERRQHQARQGASSILVTDEVIKQIRSAADTLETANARLDAAGTTITFDISVDAFAGIEIDGTPLSPERPVMRAVEPVTIAIAGRGRIVVAPAIKDRNTLLRRRRDAGTDLKAALDAAGVSSTGDAEDLHATRHKLLEQANLAGQEAALYAPATADREAGAQPLADHVEGLRRLLAREKGELGVDELPLAQDAEMALRAAEQRAQEVRDAQNTARAGLTAPEQALEHLQKELGAGTFRFVAETERLERLRDQWAESERSCPDSRLRQDIEEARAAQSKQAGLVASLEAERGDEALVQLDARIGRLEKTIEQRREKRESLKEKIAGLKSHVDIAEGAGLDEAIERTGRQTELYERERGFLEREDKVLKLLLSTLHAAERDAKARFLSPALKRVRPYLQFLFPGAEITLDENLQITGIVRETGHEETFHRLSMGTQEQVAVLARLAFAEMLVEQGRPATVVLDDALVFSDDRRMNRMFDVLNTAARKIQIIILTCREQLFEGLGGRQLAVVPGSEEELRSA